jgi:hypothetical protein
MSPRKVSSLIIGGQLARKNNMTPRTFMLLVVALATFSTVARADTWELPRPRIFAQKRGPYALKVLPDRESVFFTLDESGRELPVWQSRLVNVPVHAIVVESGKYVVTRDTWHHVGFEHCLVIYGERGKIVADFKLEDLLTQTEIATLRRTVSSRWWSDITTFEDRSRQDDFVIRIKHAGWSKVLHLTLSTGKLTQE